MFGDAYPHDFEDFPRILEDPEYPLAQHQLDWRDEADDLLQMVSLNFPNCGDKNTHTFYNLVLSLIPEC